LIQTRIPSSLVPVSTFTITYPVTMPLYSNMPIRCPPWPRRFHRKNRVGNKRRKTGLERKNNDIGTHSAERSFWDTAPCISPSLAYLTVVPVSQASGISLVQVLHVICNVPSSTPPIRSLAELSGIPNHHSCPLSKRHP
jgi:hypothetical protein